MTADTAESASSERFGRAQELDAQEAARKQSAILADLAARVEVQLVKMTEAASACSALLTELAQAARVVLNVEEIPGQSGALVSAGDPKFSTGLVGTSGRLSASFEPGAIPAASNGIGRFPDDIGKILAEAGPNAGLLGLAPFGLVGASVAESALANLRVRYDALLPTASDTIPTAEDDGIGDPDDFGERLTAGFAAAVKAAIQDAHAHGLAVSGRHDGIAIEVLPNGTTTPIDEGVEWTPTSWRTRAKG